jgi:hypothetical protein
VILLPIVAHSEKWGGYPNLFCRPHAPNAGRGRLQKGVARVFEACGPEVPASTIYSWCRRWPPNGKRPNRGERCSVVRILERVAERVELN